MLLSFNSRPHKEVDLLRQNFYHQTSHLSIHDLTRRSTSAPTFSSSGAIFQFTTSQGGRRTIPFQSIAVATFQFTTSQGGRQGYSIFSHLRVVFQFTTSQGGRLHSPFRKKLLVIFQFTTSQGGRPSLIAKIPGMISFQFTTSQGGRPRAPDRISILSGLSIHDLTRRSTYCVSGRYGRMGLSIHDLTRRSTLYHALFIDRSRRLSIHDLTRRSTAEPRRSAPVKIFQFTTSQGGRHCFDHCDNIRRIFQFTTSQGGRP